MSIQTMMKRGFHSVALLLIGVVAYFQAKGVGQLVGLALKPAERHSTLPERDATSASSPLVKDGQLVRDRNPFDSTPPPSSQAPAMPTVDASAPLSWPPCSDVGVSAAPAATTRHQAAIMSQIRVLPEQRDGKVVGLRLFGIRPGSLLGSLGLRNGDRLEAINGYEIASPEKALQAYAQLRLASHLHVQLTRVGKPLQIDLNII